MRPVLWPQGNLGERIRRTHQLSSEFRCSEHISTRKDTASNRFSVFFRVLCRFSGKCVHGSCRSSLYVVVEDQMIATNGTGQGVSLQTITKVVETVRRCQNKRKHLQYQCNSGITNGTGAANSVGKRPLMESPPHHSRRTVAPRHSLRPRAPDSSPVSRRNWPSS